MNSFRREAGKIHSEEFHGIRDVQQQVGLDVSTPRIQPQEEPMVKRHQSPEQIHASYSPWTRAEKGENSREEEEALDLFLQLALRKELQSTVEGNHKDQLHTLACEHSHMC